MTKRKNNRKTGEAARFASLYGVLIALAMVLSYVETLIPLPMLVPGAKLGLANLVTVVGLFLVGIPGTVCITVFRVVLAGLTFGNVYSMAYGLSGSFLSLFVMASVKKKRPVRPDWHQRFGRHRPQHRPAHVCGLSGAYSRRVQLSAHAAGGRLHRRDSHRAFGGNPYETAGKIRKKPALNDCIVSMFLL